MASFKRTPITTLPKVVEPLSEEAKFWTKCLESAKVVKEYGAINALDLNESSNQMLVNSVSKITLYNYNNMETVRSYNTMTHFSVYGANYRKSDYKLIVAGTEEGKINIYDVKTSKPLKFLSDNPKNKHLAPVHCVRFLSDHQILSVSDDKSIKLWDLASGSLINDIGSGDASSQIKPHTDYVRCACVIDETILASGSYDHKVKIWDPRDSSEVPKFSFSFDSPVESLIARNSLLIGCAGKTIKVFDLIAGKILKTLNNTHSKTITCLCNYDQYVLSGSLDGNIKVYDSLFNVVSPISYAPSQLLSLAVNSNAVVVGANDGLVIVKRFRQKESVKISAPRTRKRTRYFQWLEEEAEREDKEMGADNETIFVTQKKLKQPYLRYDKFLKSFNHSAALDAVLKRGTGKPEKVVSLMQELIRRSALRSALAGRNDSHLMPLCEFLCKNLRDPKFTRILVDVALILTEIYTPYINRSKEMRECFSKLNKIVNMELAVMQQMMCISGQLTAVLNNV
ncbi:U3 small nucleolar RNA-associated protein 15-like protein [Dinothrombium tinctorium]|uniref:U3 small nucleolar RNA-associated protein 15 homolog n=1 Tax=Dinothrombium tinctorium TaxID=1965070 RepID=A0A443REQ5_9ACAR|nr:U3 small nucleolar RNA-associated protein 15-like protein [Dinothrombium tinctorium]